MNYTINIGDMDSRANAIVAAHQLPAWSAGAMLRHPVGMALLALLCNAAAKEVPALYIHKSPCIRLAVVGARMWGMPVWAKPHTGYGEYPVDTVIFLQLPSCRPAFHVRRDDVLLADLIAELPYREEGWDGVALQPIARQLAVGWLETEGVNLGS